MSAGFDDQTQLSDNVSLQYGFTLDSVSFLDHLNYFSPYARLTYSLGEGAELDFAYTSGNARPDLGGAGLEDVATSSATSTAWACSRASPCAAAARRSSAAKSTR